MWKATFINQYGLEFTAQEGEPGVEDMLEYIAYCTNANSVLVSLERV